MALQQGYQVSWDDIENIYSTLNSARQKFGFSTTTIPDETNEKATPEYVSVLKTLINDLSASGYVGSAASTAAVSEPTRGTLLKATPFSDLDEIVTRVNDICAFNGTNFSGFFSSNFSGFDSSNFGFNGTNFSGFFSSNFSGFDSSNFGFNGTNFSRFFSSNFGFDSANFGFSFNGSYNNTSNFSRFFSSNFSGFFSTNFNIFESSNYSSYFGGNYRFCTSSYGNGTNFGFGFTGSYR